MNNFSQEQLRIWAQECAEKITSSENDVGYFSEPFRHLVIDDFLPLEMAELCNDAFPPLSDPSWESSADADIEVKYRSNWASEFDVPDDMVGAIRLLNSSLILKAMAQRIGIPKLVPDLYFTGGGLNITTRGGLLDVHVDGNYHDATGLNRRLNLIVYFCKGWRSDWGGEFGVYDREGQTCLKRIAPLFNRCVIFDTHDFSFHGLPDPINFPEGVERKSIILYYYTAEKRPIEHTQTEAPHSALWKKRNLSDKRGNKVRHYT